MKKLTLKNDFHNTEVVLNISLDEVKEGASFELSVGQVKKAQNALCGIDGCTCSGYLGARSGLSFAHEIDGQEVKIDIDHNQDTSAVVTIIRA